MSMMNTDHSYGSVAKFFHWLVAILIIALLIVGALLSSIEDKPYAGTIYMVHKLVGLSVLCLILLRLTWTLINPKPKLPGQPQRWEKIAEHSTHGLLYLMLIAMPLTGWIMATAAGKPPQLFGGIIAAPWIPIDKALAHFFAELHEIAAWTLFGLITLHFLAALKHHLINKDNVLKRMIPGNH